MLNFAYPYILLLLLVVVVVYLLYLWSRHMRKSNIKKFGKPDVLRQLMPEVSKYKSGIKIALRLAALACIIIALARPWGGLTQQSSERNGIEVVLAVDASNSMLASSTDDPDSPDRMTASKLLLERLIDNLGNDRVGLVVYAGQAYNLIPVSSDFASAKTFLNSIDPDQIEYQGTNIAEAVRTAESSFSGNKEVGKAIVLLTDVEELENPDDVLNAVSQAHKNGIQIDVIGVGSTRGGIIPAGNSVMTDVNGEVVHTRLNEDLGKRIAKAGGGVYVNATSSNALTTLQKQLKELKRSAMKSSVYATHEELFIYFCAAALLLLVIDVIISDKKNSWLTKVTFFKKEDEK